MNENFVKVGTTTAPEGYDRASVWETQLQSIKDAEAQGKLYLGVSHSPNSDRAAARYGYATMLLAGAGHARFALHGDYTQRELVRGVRLRDRHARGAETRDASGVHRRTFTNGLVLVNPTTASVSVQFGGAYTGSGLTDATGDDACRHAARWYSPRQVVGALSEPRDGHGRPGKQTRDGEDGPGSEPKARAPSRPEPEGPGRRPGHEPGPGGHDGPGTGTAGDAAAGRHHDADAHAAADVRATSRSPCRCGTTCRGTVQLRQGTTVVAQARRQRPRRPHASRSA